MHRSRPDSGTERFVRPLLRQRFLLALSLGALHAPSHAAPLGVSEPFALERTDARPCPEAAQVELTAPRASDFDASRASLERALGLARIALTFDCPDLVGVELLGRTSDGPTVFRATAMADDGWLLDVRDSPATHVLDAVDRAGTDLWKLIALAPQIDAIVGAGADRDATQAKGLEQRLLRMVDLNLADDGRRLERWIDAELSRHATLDQALDSIDDALVVVGRFLPASAERLEGAAERIQGAALRQRYAERLLAIDADGEVSAQRSVRAAIDAIDSVSSRDAFVRVVDERLADTLATRFASLLDTFEQAELAQMGELRSHVGDILGSGSPALKDLDKRLIRTARTIASAEDGVKAALRAMLLRLQQDAVAAIDRSGNGIEDVPGVLATTDELIAELKNDDDPELTTPIERAGARRVEQLVRDGEAAFLEAAGESELTIQRLGEYRALRDEIAGLGDAVAALPQARALATQAYDEHLLATCDRMLSIASDGVVPDSDTDLILDTGTSRYYFGEAACAMLDNGHEIVGFGLGDNEVVVLAVQVVPIDTPDGASEEKAPTEDAVAQRVDFELTLLEEEDGTLVIADTGQRSGSLDLLIEPPPTGVPDENGVTECDLLVSDVDDPAKVTDRSAFDTLDERTGQRAMDSCLAAIEHDPQNPRLQYLMARIAAYMGESEQASAALGRAVDGKHSAALSLKADIIMQTAADQNSVVDAFELYAAATRGGYAVAGPRMRELMIDGAEPYRQVLAPTSQDMKSVFSGTKTTPSFLGVTISYRFNGADVRNCFQTGKNLFQCEYRVRFSCSTNASSAHNMLLGSMCQAGDWDFGTFEKQGAGWRKR